MSRKGLPDILNQIKPAFEQHFGNQFSGTLLNNLLALGAQEDLRPHWLGMTRPKPLIFQGPFMDNFFSVSTDAWDWPRKVSVLLTYQVQQHP
jgi:hypothetical protein